MLQSDSTFRDAWGQQKRDIFPMGDVLGTSNVCVSVCLCVGVCICVNGGIVVLQDFCRVLSELHDKAPVHKWEASKAAIEKAFGLPVEQMFESIDHSAIASGSIAQVAPSTNPNPPPRPPPPPHTHPLLLCLEPDFVDSKCRLAWYGLYLLGALATLLVLFATLHMYNHIYWVFSFNANCSHHCGTETGVKEMPTHFMFLRASTAVPWLLHSIAQVHHVLPVSE